MPEMYFRFVTGAVTHEGRVRDHNEDRFLVVDRAGLWVVADGMGGHQGGEVASGKIVEALASIGVAASAPDFQARFLDRLENANSAIQDYSRQRGGAIIGSTVVAILVHEKEFACIWSGDSRAYRLRDGELRQVSRDHTEAQELLDRGVITAEEAENWPRKNVITRAVGVAPQVSYDVVSGRVKDGDQFLLCSDGLTGHVEDDEIRAALMAHGPQEACQQLLDLTLKRGATDNVTIVIVRASVKTLVVGEGAAAGGQAAGQPAQDIWS
ncbi:PP2C family protein-serine/threonine phosphatase [Acidimangrovimonas sediminis]|uniref:PP2C family protein-serine/threonine phosphatase n=1 Tax=Acidimangrovimonas sediminis TaxID=2056283 RepID=UPI000C803D62|nr:protein phosphatase 2C domain-containing protein [Acidimangrovimonas sediminis]